MIFEIEYSLENISNAVNQLLEAINLGPKIWLFRGQMGAGKTTLVKEIGQQLKIKSIVQSPTFSLVNPYETESGEIIYHFDLYRLENVHEAVDIGIEEYLDSGHLCFIEWPERAESLWNIPHINIEIIQLTEFSRKLTCNWQS
jgi:tRNA threonylcarbamoyladenosine biosynthesis protein TsaE